MSDGVEIRGGMPITNSKSFLSRRFEARVIAFAFGAQRINRLKFIRISVKFQLRFAGGGGQLAALGKTS